MYVLQHPESKTIVGVRFEANSDEDVNPLLVCFDINDDETYMLILNKERMQSFYDAYHAHYAEREIYGFWVGDYVCYIPDLFEYQIVPLRDIV